MPRLFLALAREQVDPKIDCRRDTDSPRANGSKPEVRKGDLSGGSGRVFGNSNSGSAKGADRDDPMTAEPFTAVRVMVTPLRRCVSHLAHLQREVLVFEVTY
jgi:hypothetical protein